MNDKESNTTNIPEIFKAAMVYDVICNMIMFIMFIIGTSVFKHFMPSVFAYFGVLSIVSYMLSAAEYMHQYGLNSSRASLIRIKTIASILNRVSYVLFLTYIITCALFTLRYV